MEHFLKTLPAVFIYWSSALIVWSCIVFGMQTRIILAARKIQKYTRSSDTIILITVAIGAMILFIPTFVIPEVSVLFVEVLLILCLWYTVFLMMINILNVNCWVNYCKTQIIDWSFFPSINITAKQHHTNRNYVNRHSTPNSTISIISQ